MDADGMRCVRQIEEMKNNGKLSLIRHYHIFQLTYYIQIQDLMYCFKKIIGNTSP